MNVQIFGSMTEHKEHHLTWGETKKKLHKYCQRTSTLFLVVSTPISLSCHYIQHVLEVPLQIYTNVSGRYYYIYSQNANVVQTPMTQQLTETRATITTVLSTVANNKMKCK